MYSLSAKALIFNTDGCCLLLKRSLASKNNPGLYDLPGGKEEKDELFLQTLLREVREETGLEIEITGLAGSVLSQNPRYKVINLIMTAVCNSGSPRLSAEHEDYLWVHPDEFNRIDIVEHLKQEALRYFEQNYSVV